MTAQGNAEGAGERWSRRDNIFLDKNDGFSGRIWEIVRLISLPYPAALVYYVILLEGNKDIENSLSPVFMILVWVGIFVISLVGALLRISKRKYRDIMEGANAVKEFTRWAGIGTEWFHLVRTVSTNFALSLIVFYLFYKVNEVGFPARPSDWARKFGIGLESGALIADFLVACFLSSLLMLSSTALMVVVRRKGGFSSVFRASYKHGLLLTLFLVITSTAMFASFFIWNEWLEDFIRWLNSTFETLLRQFLQSKQ